MQLRKSIVLAAAIAGALTLSRLSSAQAHVPNPFSIQTNAYLAAGSPTNTLSFEFQGSSQGKQVNAAGSQSFTGLDSNGNQQTMTFSGSSMARAEADALNPGYFALHAYAQGSITNPYYNPSNSTYFDAGTYDPNGSPQYLQSVGQAVWNDTLFLSPNDGVVGIRYVFGWNGSFVDYDHAYSYLAFNAGNNGTVFFNNHGETGGNWATDTWNVSGTAIGMSGNFGAVVGYNTADIAEGVFQSATADLSDTLTLDSIELLDANGNLISGAHYTTDSGLHYNVLGGSYGASPVPEPGMMATAVALGIFGVGCGIRRRKR